MVTEVRDMAQNVISEREDYPGLWPGARIVVGDHRYEVQYVQYEEKLTGVVQTAHVAKVAPKGWIGIEPGFLERDDMPVDKGGVPS